MFGIQFYPTSEETLELMLKPHIKEYETRYGLKKYLKIGDNILEPSAGKGDICDYIRNLDGHKRRKISTIEIDPNLQSILVDKGYKLIETDFFDYNSHYYFDFIIMNPPFKNGTKHCLKAWEILNNGDLICLLNSETINNPYSRDRQYLLSLIEQHGSVEHIGQAFSDSERKANVETCIIRLNKPKVKTNINFDLDSDVHNEDTFSASYLASSDLIESLVSQYDRATAITIQRNKLKKELQFYMSGIDKNEDIAKIDIAINDQIDDLKTQFWNYVFNKTQIGMRVTSNYREKFETHKAMVENVSFTHKNISQVLQNFIINQKEIMNECMNDVFLAITEHHYKNKVSEGWKTNKSWKINSKIIVPYGVSYDSRFNTWSNNYSKHDFYEDLDKTCCYLSNIKREDLKESIYDTLDKFTTNLNRNSTDYQCYFTSSFFRIKIHKKGTVHLYFRDEKVCEDFNIQVAKNKRWIGDEY